MKYLLEPEVSGSLGRDSVLDTSVHPPVVDHVDYQVHGWCGDDLLESFPVFVASPELVNALAAEGITGFIDRGSGVISFDEQCRSREHAWERVKDFRWIEVGGVWSEDLSMREGLLAVSGRAWEVLCRFKLDNCTVTEAPDPELVERSIG
ncbi:MAG: hypothetical protein DI630_00105 [Gordonia sp. (in: high G+C Gram-positive bacteria)]|nr:MAG: hypothetical protein DI630_00105 [Gordonia sp. (in: high G+C Gram-positive bacteria)]